MVETMNSLDGEARLEEARFEEARFEESRFEDRYRADHDMEYLNEVSINVTRQ